MSAPDCDPSLSERNHDATCQFLRIDRGPGVYFWASGVSELCQERSFQYPSFQT